MALPAPKKSGNDAAGVTGNADAMFHVIRPRQPQVTGAHGADRNADEFFHVVGESEGKSGNAPAPDSMQLATHSLGAGSSASLAKGIGTGKIGGPAAAQGLKGKKGAGEDRSYKSGGDPLK